jgi:hypothetical protein
MTQYRLTQSIHIATLEADGDDANLNVFVKVGIEANGFCAKILGALAGVAAAISPIAGGALALGALNCN